MFVKKAVSEFPELIGLTEYIPEGMGYIAGGFFKDYFLKKHSKDLDIFFSSAEQFEQRRNFFESKAGFTKKYSTDNSIGFEDTAGQNIDLVRPSFRRNPREMLNTFDFTVSKFCLYYSELEKDYFCLYHKDFFEHLTQRKLVIDDGITFPFGTFERALRYSHYGFHLDICSRYALIVAINNLTGSEMDYSFKRDRYSQL